MQRRPDFIYNLKWPYNPNVTYPNLCCFIPILRPIVVLQTRRHIFNCWKMNVQYSVCKMYSTYVVCKIIIITVTNWTLRPLLALFGAHLVLHVSSWRFKHYAQGGVAPVRHRVPIHLNSGVESRWVETDIMLGTFFWRGGGRGDCTRIECRPNKFARIQ